VIQFTIGTKKLQPALAEGYTASLMSLCLLLEGQLVEPAILANLRKLHGML
jgi:hypothetical protein